MPAIVISVTRIHLAIGQMTHAQEDQANAYQPGGIGIAKNGHDAGKTQRNKEGHTQSQKAATHAR